MEMPLEKKKPEGDDEQPIKPSTVDNTVHGSPKGSASATSMEAHAKVHDRPATATGEESMSISGPYPFMKKVPREIRDMIYGYVFDRSGIFEPYYAAVHLFVSAGQRQMRSFPAVEVAKYLLSHRVYRELYDCNWNLSRHREYRALMDYNWTLFDVSKQIRAESISIFYMILKLPSMTPQTLRYFFKFLRWECIGQLQNITMDCSAIDYYNYAEYLEAEKAHPSYTHLDYEIHDTTCVFRSLATCQGLNEIRLSFSDLSLSDWGVYDQPEQDSDHIFMRATWKRLMVKSFERKGLDLTLLEASREGRDGLGEHVVWWERKPKREIARLQETACSGY